MQGFTIWRRRHSWHAAKADQHQAQHSGFYTRVVRESKTSSIWLVLTKPGRTRTMHCCREKRWQSANPDGRGSLYRFYYSWKPATIDQKIIPLAGRRA